MNGNKKILILGVGISGQETARWAVGQGFSVRVSDVKPLDAWPRDFYEWCVANGVEIEAEKHGTEGLNRFQLVVVSPGIDPNIEVLRAARSLYIPIVGELFLAASLWKGPILAITGTNGKTTTTKLVGDILQHMGVQHVVAGNIGRPLISFVNEDVERVAVLEMSSFQLDTFLNEPVLGLSMPKFHAFAILNIEPDHLDRYDDFATYAHSKLRGLEFLRQDGVAVMNMRILAMANDRGINTYGWSTFGEEKGPGPCAVIKDGLIEVCGMNGPEVYDTTQWRLKGLHNLENLAAAILMVRSLYGVEQAAPGISAAISNFEPPSHRLQFVAEIDGVVFYDDSKATNVGAVHTALAAMNRPVVLIAGGRGKGEAYEGLKKWAENGRIKALVVLGEEGPAIAKCFDGVCPVYEVTDMSSGISAMQQAVQYAIKTALPGDAVLLAPACASFDLFKSYAERGDVFQKIVRQSLGEVSIHV